MRRRKELHLRLRCNWKVGRWRCLCYCCWKRRLIPRRINLVTPALARWNLGCSSLWFRFETSCLLRIRSFSWFLYFCLCRLPVRRSIWCSWASCLSTAGFFTSGIRSWYLRTTKSKGNLRYLCRVFCPTSFPQTALFSAQYWTSGFKGMHF